MPGFTIILYDFKAKMSYKYILRALNAISDEAASAELKKTCYNLNNKLKNNAIDYPEAVKELSDHVIQFDDITYFQKYLSNILLALVSLKIPLIPVFSNSNVQLCSDLEKLNHLEYSVVLALLSDHPDILQYALKYFETNTVAPFDVFFQHENSYNVAPKKRRLQNCRQKITEYHIVKCCHNFLTKLPNEFSAKWDWSKFVLDFSGHDNKEIRWMVKDCMTILANMTDVQSRILAKNLQISDIEESKYLEHEKSIEIQSLDDGTPDQEVCKGKVVNIDGILLPVYEIENVQLGSLVPVKSTINNLRSLALAVASGKALCLMGPVGSGKTSLVEHLAAITGRKSKAFKKVQLGDQTDSRMLLGSHQCTDIPGEFVWRPGVLTDAVQYGHWLLLEDIDCAALDVASTLSSLLERNALSVPGYCDSLPVTPGFQLFVTQRTVATNYGFQKKISSSSALLQKHLAQINVEPLSKSELTELVQTLYPTLSTICSRMIEVFLMFSVGSHDTSLQNTESNKVSSTPHVNIMRGSRLISTRDLIKWCSRAIVGFDVTSPESALKVLQDALDIFTCSVSSPEHRLELSKKVGTLLGVNEITSEFYCKNHKPPVKLNPSAIEVGRTAVPRKEKSLETTKFDTKQTVFSFTRQSACLMERIACCVISNEPVLLVGETGTGKTSSVQYLARQTGHNLVVINMNQQSDSSDLLGGYKPVDLKFVINPIRVEFETLFKSFYNIQKNHKFLNHIENCYESENWNNLLSLMTECYRSATVRLLKQNRNDVLIMWKKFGNKLTRLGRQIKAASNLTFAFIEGSLVKAMQDGHWVLLDEINLASAEILECLAGLLDDKNDSIDLLEKGDKVPIKRHPDFTLFACMNPATDVGKKDLPVGLRNRFTEFFIDDLIDRNDIILLVGDYLYHMNLPSSTLEAIYLFYSSIRKEAQLNLVDGAGNAPHYSLRTLCRALTAAAKAKCGTVSRSLYEAFCLSFLTQLDSSSHPKVEAMIAKAVFGKKNIKSVLNQLIPEPQVKGQQYLLFEGHWIPQGKLDITIPEGYILTPTVRKNLRDIARIISLGKLPVLLQGDTSVGKTSLITYIAKTSGNYCVRINNHEHTDLQEYIGSYASDANGKLVFKEGVLVEAMRKGYWIILDELNLAPSDVLEALNRVLDDNRELFIPETQQVVRADPNFMLFATQNPPGLYGGRKMLSRAFRNRFVELHFDEIPRKELETILHQRCHIPPTYSKKMIAVMAELQMRRRGSAAVQGKDGFITLRDLFRWGQRYKLASKDILTNDKFYDWDQHIADEGYLVLAGKVRQPEERHVIVEVIEKHIKRKVEPNNLFSLTPSTSPITKSILETFLNNQLNEFSHVVWTYNMRRLAVLIAKSFTFNEPVLLVGETGCGKTTICQVIAALKGIQLLSVNCHMHTESADFIGGLRPVRQYKNDGRLFEWVDGPLIKAMETGDMFLADEISLADDSVLERLNSLLEPERQLVLAERGTDDGADILIITASNNFHFIGTMNPGGDFGKKELSPALRNRFTEIWCDNVASRQDLLKVLEKSVHKGISLGNQEDGSSGIGNCILNFVEWLKKSEVTNNFPFSIRDLLSWVHFINVTVSKHLLDPPEAYVHGACMSFLDCFGTALTGHVDHKTLLMLRNTAIDFLLHQIKTFDNESFANVKELLTNVNIRFIAESDASKFGIKPFYIDVGTAPRDVEDNFTFTAPTTGANTLRLLRGLQLNKAILLEGNPGVGKTSLVTALAKVSGHKVVRINLSDQTDITDLFGTDLPSEGGSFVFKEGSFLRALQNGDWILLDELNLAPQPVLEGLNACLDHRGEVYIPELGKTFKVKQETRLFACQNPLKQGGARRGLPISFLNRFTQVYVDTLTREDLVFIIESQYPTISKDIIHRVVTFNCLIVHEINVLQSWGHMGSPWEMNLRDIQRWCDAMVNNQLSGLDLSPGKFVDMLYVNRMRTCEDKMRMARIYDDLFHPTYKRSQENPQFEITEGEILFGDVNMERNTDKKYRNRKDLKSSLVIMRNQLPVLKALAQNVKMNWLSIIVGSTATGKSSVVQVLADLTGNELQVVPVTSAMDVSDLLGGFEQVDYNRNLQTIFDKIESLTIQIVRNLWLKQSKNNSSTKKLLNNVHAYKSLYGFTDNIDAIYNDSIKFKEKIEFLLSHCDELLTYAKEDNMSLLNEMRASLNVLLNKISKNQSVNTGGKFEWVDSLLVKSMIEGSWLLLDNVNLTSAAVLDRLNGLLETNGVLSIPERGEVSEIVPHPNFRIFFTMDPKYGEISRAMRNRGVEIYMLQFDDTNMNVLDRTPRMDLNALLASSGLPSNYHEICIDIHNQMSSFIQGLEKPTISQLLQAAYLIWQQILRGISVKLSIVNSFSDVYIKPRCGGDFVTVVNTTLAEMKNTMYNALQKIVQDYKFWDASQTCHTLSVASLCKHSSHEIIKQIAYPVLQQALHDDYKSVYYCLFDILLAYQKCPNGLVSKMHHMIMETKMSKQAETLIFTLNDFISTSTQSYKRYNEYYKLSNKELYTTNASYLQMYNTLIKVFNNNNIEKCSFSALDYSKAVLQGNLADDFVQYPILKQCYNYIHNINKHIQAVLSSNEVEMDDAIACKIIQLLNWRNRFIKVCSISIFVKTKKRNPLLKEDLVPILEMHYKWLKKYLVSEINKTLPPNHVAIAQYNAQDIGGNNFGEKNAIHKISKKVRKLNGQPKLYGNCDEYELCVQKEELYSKLSFNYKLPIQTQMHKLSIDVATTTNYSLALDVPESISLSMINESVLKLFSDDNSKIQKYDLKLLPIIETVIARVINLLKNSFLKSFSGQDERKTILFGDAYDIQKESELLSNLVAVTKSTKGFPPKYRDLLELKLRLQDPTFAENKRISSFTVTFWNELYKHLLNSPARVPNLFMVSNENNSETSVCTRISTNMPLISYLVHNLTTIKNDGGRISLAYESVSLQDQSNYSALLKTGHNILWKNIAMLSSSAAFKLKTDAIFEMRKFQQLICYLYFVKYDNLSSIEYCNQVFEQVLSYLQENCAFVNIVQEARKLHDELSVISTDMLDNRSKMKVSVLTTKLSMLTGLLSLRLMAEISPVDEIEKHRLKVNYIEEDIKMFDTLLSAYYIQGVVSGTIHEFGNCTKSSDVAPGNWDLSRLESVHPFCPVLLRLKKETAEMCHKYAHGNTFRPSEPTYYNFAKDCKHFAISVLSDTAMAAIMGDNIKVCDALFEDFMKGQTNSATIRNAHTTIKETSSWIYSVEAFYKILETKYSEAFPDLTKPLLMSLSQVMYNVSNMNDMIQNLAVLIAHKDGVSSALTELIVYPNNIPKYGERHSHLNRFLDNRNLLHYLNRNGILNDGENAVLDVLKMCLSELQMYCFSVEEIDNTSIEVISNTLDNIVKVWDKQQANIEQKKQDDDALFVTKSKCEDIDEDLEAYEEISEMFPSYTEMDFNEFKGPSLEQRKLPRKPQPSNNGHILTSEDITMIYEWHSSVIHNLSSAEWITAPKNVLLPDYKGPLMMRFQIFSSVIENTWTALDPDFENKMSPTLLLLMSSVRNALDGEESQVQKTDFYRSSWISETRQCLPLLHRVREATKILLDQWPDFPSLKDIIVIVDRILGFSITSPVARFLTGLELLRDKIEEWNKNAHKGNNMIDVSLEVGQQIIDWRKLEMSHWKECLNSVNKRMVAEGHKYWFHMYNVTHSHLTGESNSDSVTAVLQNFMENSNLAEYDVRLNLIYVYHCHLIHVDRSGKRDELISILWNTYNYYSQFSEQVAMYIKQKRAPIEKKLKDFVKISSWDRDLSYWSVKDTVEKAHKVLHKHTKEFENLLKEGVANLIGNMGNDHVEIVGKTKRSVTLHTPEPLGTYLALPKNVKKYIDHAQQPTTLADEGSLLQKVSSLFKKAEVICKDTMERTNYSHLVQRLDDFVTQVIETSSHLESLEVDAGATKEKQTSQAKNILQQKRKALSDLFRYLTKIGLNYRTGLVLLNANDTLYDFTLPPVDLDAALSYLKNKRCDTTLSMFWSGCEKYFQRNIARHKFLSTSLLTPHQDLGLQNIDRCKGFAAVLMKMTAVQKNSISIYSRQLCDLRTIASNFTAALDIDKTEKQFSVLKDEIFIMFDCYANFSIVLEQFYILLKSCPVQSDYSGCEPAFDSVLSNSPLVNCYKNSQEWIKLVDKVKSILAMVKKQKISLQKLKTPSPKVYGEMNELYTYSQEHIRQVEDAKEVLLVIKSDLDNIFQEYRLNIAYNENERNNSDHPVIRSVVTLSDYIQETMAKIDCLNTNVNIAMEVDIVEEYAKKTEDAVATMLLIMQSIYKNHSTTLKEDKVLDAIDELLEQGQSTQSNDVVDDGHLKELLQERLSRDVKLLQLNSLVDKTSSLLNTYIKYSHDVEVADSLKDLASRAIPILEQTILFTQYFITQQVALHRVSCKMLAVLLKIFTDLSTKGFCKPADIDTEDGQHDGGPGKLSGGTGLGEGEGQTDVSEKIENQDQLDDAMKPGEERKEEERDCKEEEKGVNMTDDFDSHLQDVDKKDGDNSEQEDGEDADKQMGETDNAAEKLDQQIWGSDDEDLQEEENQNDKEEKGKGESTGEKEMGAKEEEEHGVDDGLDGEDKKKKDINEMQEPEVDDDHVDPYHGNAQTLPEPEEFDLPDNMNLDGDEEGEDKDGETETENPFEVDITKDNMPDEKEDEKGDDKAKDYEKQVLSSDSEEEESEDKNQEDYSKDDNGEINDKEKEPVDEDDGTDDDNAEGITEDKSQEQEQNDTEKEEDMPVNPEKINEEDEKIEETKERNTEAHPSNDDQSQEDAAENAETKQGTDDNVQMNPDQKKDEDAEPSELTQEQVGDEKEATGRSELDDSDKGHKGRKEKASRSDNSALNQEKQKRHENKPGKTEQDRTLGDVNSEKQKKTRTLNIEDENNGEEGGENKNDETEEACHVKQANENDIQAIDAATKEQADEQPTLQKEGEDEDEMKSDDEIAMDVDEDEMQVDKAEEILPEKVGQNKEEKDKSRSNKDGGDERTGDTAVEVEGDNVVTESVPRGAETTYHTRLENGINATSSVDMAIEDYTSIREWLLASRVGSMGGVEAAAAWRSLWRDTGGQARALCERLRLVLEPTARSRLAGDYRTGRRINMRRVIPYIASHFRKDRIWLRRTKPAKREYKIAVAIDDSSSMSDNRSKELAFESLALVSQALNLLESGDLAVLSFGEQPSVLHPFTEQFSEHSGAKILEKLLFNQTKTKIAQLLDYCSVLFEQQSMRSDTFIAKLLVIVSDGRGIFSEGETKVMQAVRRARQQGIFLVYVVIDNPDNKDSIMDIRRPFFDPVTNSLVGFVSYLDTFPFPFYLILRDMAALPNVLGDALRQWFELAANNSC